MSLQLWVSIGSLIAVIIGIISLGITLHQDRQSRESILKQEREARETEIKAHTEQWTKLNYHIDEMQKKIDSIDHTIGNGFAGSIKEQIRELRENCTCKMVSLEKQVELNTPRIEKLEDKVNVLEKTN